MEKLAYTRKTYYLATADEQAITTLKARYGLSTDSDAVRLALRLVAESPMVQVAATKRRPAR